MNVPDRKLVVTIEPGADPIAGTVRDEAGNTTRFVGYVQLFERLESCREGALAGTEGALAGPSAPFDGPEEAEPGLRNGRREEG